MTCVSAQPRPVADWILEHRHEALALQVRRRLDAAQLGERREQVDVRDRAIWRRRPSLPRRGDDQQRHAGTLLEQAHLLPQAVLAHVIAVVAGEDDDRVVGQAEPVERVDDAADLRVHEADAGVVCLPALAAEVVGQLRPAPSCSCRGRRGGMSAWSSFTPCDHGISFSGYRSKYGFRRDVRRVRPEEADGQEERPVLCASRSARAPTRRPRPSGRRCGARRSWATRTS